MGEAAGYDRAVIAVVPANAGIQSYLTKTPCIYILASKHNGTLYIGVTAYPQKRVYGHKNNLVEGFTKKYRVHILVHIECYETMDEAIHREICLKEWNRAWKLELIEKNNPNWNDLYETIL